ncbi:MAG: tail fiber domain-containing protein [Patescibacteria group bacterium]
MKEFFVATNSKLGVRGFFAPNNFVGQRQRNSGFVEILPGAIIGIFALAFLSLGGAYTLRNKCEFGQYIDGITGQKNGKYSREFCQTSSSSDYTQPSPISAVMKGEKGDKGDSGEIGLSGPSGRDGIKGETGAKGERGEKGDKGDKGDRGDKGDTGATGPAGTSGSGASVWGGITGDINTQSDLQSSFAQKQNLLSSNNISQWTNDSLYITSSSTDALTNKTSITSSGTITFSSLGTGILQSNSSGVLSNLLGTQNYLPKWTTSGLTTSSMIYDSGTGVGIGTTNPGAIFSINQSASSPNEAFWLSRFNDTSTSGPQLKTFRYRGSESSPSNLQNGDYLGGFNAYGYVRNAADTSFTNMNLAQIQALVSNVDGAGRASGSFAFNTRDLSGTLTERLRIDSTGKVGIGTTSPAGALDVEGTIIGNYLSAELSIIANGSIGTDYQNYGAGYTYGFSTDGNGNITVKGTGNSSFAGKVGIGTTNPTNLLSIYGSGSDPGNVQFDVTNSNSSGDTRFTLNNSGTGQIIFQATGADYLIPNTGNIFTQGDMQKLSFMTNGDMSSGGTGYISFLTGGYDPSNERMRVTASGNVGIGTTSPAGRLQVTGGASGNVSLVLRGNSSNDANLQEWRLNDGSLQTTITSRGFIDLSGANGSSTFNPIIKFNTHHVGNSELSGGFDNGILKESSLGRILVNFVTNNSTNSLFSGGVDGEGYRRFAISGGGTWYVGPGTSGVDTSLARSSGAGFYVNSTVTSANIFDIQGVSSQTGDYFDISSYGGATGDLLTVTSTGLVGIGTTNPQQPLHVYRGSDGAPVRFEDTNGYCEINPTSTTWTCTSDRTLKKDIETIDNAEALRRINLLDAVTFRWNKQDENDKKSYGLIAQDVEKIFPEFVTTSESGLKSVSYGSFTPVLISAIKAQQVQIGALEKLGLTQNIQYDQIKGLTFLTPINAGDIQTNSLNADSISVNGENVLTQKSVNDFSALLDTLKSNIASLATISDSIVTFGKRVVFEATAQFENSAIFNSSVIFNKRLVQNDGDVAGVATIRALTRKIDIKFDQPYETIPIINLTLNVANEDDTLFLSDLRPAVTNVSKDGFTIILSESTARDIDISWIAVAAPRYKISKGESIIEATSSAEFDNEIIGSDSASMTETTPTPTTTSIAN